MCYNISDIEVITMMKILVINLRSTERREGESRYSADDRVLFFEL